MSRVTYAACVAVKNRNFSCQKPLPLVLSTACSTLMSQGMFYRPKNVGFYISCVCFFLLHSAILFDFGSQTVIPCFVTSDGFWKYGMVQNQCRNGSSDNNQGTYCSQRDRRIKIFGRNPYLNSGNDLSIDQSMNLSAVIIILPIFSFSSKYLLRQRWARSIDIWKIYLLSILHIHYIHILYT